MNQPKDRPTNYFYHRAHCDVHFFMILAIVCIEFIFSSVAGIYVTFQLSVLRYIHAKVKTDAFLKQFNVLLSNAWNKCMRYKVVLNTFSHAAVLFHSRMFFEKKRYLTQRTSYMVLCNLLVRNDSYQNGGWNVAIT